MNQFTYADLCEALAVTIQQIGRLETLPPRFWDADHRQNLETLRARREALRAAIRHYEEK